MYALSAFTVDFRTENWSALDFKYTQPDVWRKEIIYSLSEKSEWNNFIILHGKLGFLYIFAVVHVTPRQTQKHLDPELTASEWCQNWKAADQGLS